MSWVSVILFIITNIPKLITLVKQLLELFDNDKKEVKDVLPKLLDTEIKKADSGPLRKVLRGRFERASKH